MPVCGLEDYRLGLAGLARLGQVDVTFSVQLTGVSLSKLLPLRPREREARLRAALKKQFASLARRFPQAGFESRNLQKGSWTLDGHLPANQILRLASEPQVADLWISAIAGRNRYRTRAKKAWFCVWGIVAIQVERQRSRWMQLEDRLVLIKAHDQYDAINRLRPEWEKYAKPYLNPNGHLVRWQLIGIKGVHGLSDERISSQGTEVYSRLRRVKVRAEYRWRASKPAPRKRKL